MRTYAKRLLLSYQWLIIQLSFNESIIKRDKQILIINIRVNKKKKNLKGLIFILFLIHTKQSTDELSEFLALSIVFSICMYHSQDCSFSYFSLSGFFLCFWTCGGPHHIHLPCSLYFPFISSTLFTVTQCNLKSYYSK